MLLSLPWLSVSVCWVSRPEMSKPKLRYATSRREAAEWESCVRVIAAGMTNQVGELDWRQDWIHS